MSEALTQAAVAISSAFHLVHPYLQATWEALQSSLNPVQNAISS